MIEIGSRKREESEREWKRDSGGDLQEPLGYIAMPCILKSSSSIQNEREFLSKNVKEDECERRWRIQQSQKSKK